MHSLPLVIYFVLALFSMCLYVFFKVRTNKEFSFLRTFPYESNKDSRAISATVVLSFLFAICSVLFYFHIYSGTFDSSYVLLATISAVIISICFVILNLVNIVNLRLHFLVFSIFTALVTTQSIVLGTHSLYLYKLDGVNVSFVVIAVVLFLKALIELLLVSPIFKFSFAMEVDKANGTMTKPKFVRLAFYEWLYLLLFIINTLILLIQRII